MKSVPHFAFALLLAGSVLVLPGSATAAGNLDKPTGQVVLTIVGAIEKSNRATYNDSKDLFFKFHEKKFEKAAEFDLAMIEKIGLRKHKIGIPGDKKLRLVEGVRLKSLLSLVGAKPKTLTITALDGFSVEISRKDLNAHNWILVLKENGRYLSIGQRGPLWLVFPPAAKNGIATAEEEGKWPWASFLMKVDGE